MVVGLASYGAYRYFVPQLEPAESPTADEGELAEEPSDETDDLFSDNQTGVMEFDDCGKKDKYKNLSWWSDFTEQIERINFYSENHIQSVIGDLTYEEFCEKRSMRDICGGRVNRKLEIAQFGEGCLSKNNSLFIAVFPGEYMGGGNNIFSYQINEGLLEKTKKINEDSGKVWRDPPHSFLKREDQIINMEGAGGDAGCWSRSDYQYNYVTNEVKLIKRCEGCQREEGTCELYD